MQTSSTFALVTPSVSSSIGLNYCFFSGQFWIGINTTEIEKSNEFIVGSSANKAEPSINPSDFKNILREKLLNINKNVSDEILFQTRKKEGGNVIKTDDTPNVNKKKS